MGDTHAALVDKVQVDDDLAIAIAVELGNPDGVPSIHHAPMAIVVPVLVEGLEVEIASHHYRHTEVAIRLGEVEADCVGDVGVRDLAIGWRGDGERVRIAILRCGVSTNQYQRA